MMKEDDAAELIAKSADTTLGVIGGDLTDKRCICLCLCFCLYLYLLGVIRGVLTDKRCLCLYLCLGVIGHDWTEERGLWEVGGCRMSVWSI